jgi:hypothetical protein
MKGAARGPFAVVMTLGALLCPGAAFAAEAPAASTVPSPAPAPPAKRLNLGPYVDPYGHTTMDRLLEVPHFETRIEVRGKAMDAVALTARMEWWMRDYEPIRGSVPRNGSAPSLEEMRDVRHHVTEPINILPVLDWLLGKLNKKP